MVVGWWGGGGGGGDSPAGPCWCTQASTTWGHQCWHLRPFVPALPAVPAGPAVPQVMLDFHVCSWTSQPGLSAENSSLARHFDSLNEPAFSATLQVGSSTSTDRQLGRTCRADINGRSASHLPNTRCCPAPAAAANRGAGGGGGRAAAAHDQLFALPSPPGAAAREAHAVRAGRGCTGGRARLGMRKPGWRYVPAELPVQPSRARPPAHAPLAPAVTTPTWPRPAAATSWRPASGGCARAPTCLATRVWGVVVVVMVVVGRPVWGAALWRHFPACSQKPRARPPTTRLRPRPARCAHPPQALQLGRGD